MNTNCFIKKYKTCLALYLSYLTINAIENNKYDPSLQLTFDITSHLGAMMEESFIPSKNGEKKNR